MVQHIVTERTGNGDPYAAVKRRDMQTALALLPELEALLSQKDDRVYWALKAAATGNVLDSAVGLSVDIGCFGAEFETPFAVCDIDAFTDKLKTAKTMLVIGDNTGETVFDGLLLKQFPSLRIRYAVRHAPVLNDATLEIAKESGLAAYADILSTGCGVPGVLLHECSEEFLTVFHHADIVISKGQGNYETLSDSPRDLFFLLKAKCPVIARTLGVRLNDFVFRYGAGKQAQ
ncbi:MAG: DUF89 family protein [Firmicutes bacterium]|nr:DUF89 family protein [Bacillota bacterium]